MADRTIKVTLLEGDFNALSLAEVLSVTHYIVAAK